MSSRLFIEGYKTKTALALLLFPHYFLCYFQVFERVDVQENFCFFGYYGACFDFSFSLNFRAVHDVNSRNRVPNTLVLVRWKKRKAPSPHALLSGRKPPRNLCRIPQTRLRPCPRTFQLPLANLRESSTPHQLNQPRATACFKSS